MQLMLKNLNKEPAVKLSSKTFSNICLFLVKVSLNIKTK